MKTAVCASALFGAAFAASVPRQASSSDIDPVVLNFALTLEHLENNFYKGALAKFKQADFVAAGAPESFFRDLQYISYDEATHVKELTAALTAAKVTPVEECTYNFPYTDAKSFLGLSRILEGVGTSAYLGAAPLITSKDYLTAAGSILVSEALHTSLLRSATGLVPNANPNGTPIDPTTAFSLAAPFFKSCPAGNPALPFTAFPAAAGSPASVNQGDQVTLTAANGTVPAGSYLTFISGLAVVSVQGSVNGQSISAAAPKEASGQTYVVITKSDANGKLSDTDVVAGPAIIEVAPAPIMAPAYGGAPTPAPSPSTGGSGNSTTTTPAPAYSSAGSAPAPSTSGSASSPAPAPATSQVTSGASKFAVGSFALVAFAAAALF